MDFSSICLQALAASASLSEDDVQKAAILRRIVEKYTPHPAGCLLPEAMAAGTTVTQVAPASSTGKHY